jgi:hypothetical protein
MFIRFLASARIGLGRGRVRENVANLMHNRRIRKEAIMMRVAAGFNPKASAVRGARYAAFGVALFCQR